MLEWTGLADMTPLAMVTVVLGLPYLLIATGRLVPRSQCRDWKDAWEKSEAARNTDSETTQRLLAYAESADTLLRTTLGPAGEQDRERDGK